MENNTKRRDYVAEQSGEGDYVELKFSLRMFLKGIFLIGLYIYNLAFYEENFAFLDSIFGNFIAGLVVYVIGMYAGIFIFIFRGMMLIVFSKTGVIDDRWDGIKYFNSPAVSQNPNSYENIARVTDWAESKARFQTRDDASKTMLTINSLNSMRDTEQGRRTLDYLDSKMHWNTREDGFNMISDKLSD